MMHRQPVVCVCVSVCVRALSLCFLTQLSFLPPRRQKYITSESTTGQLAKRSIETFAAVELLAISELFWLSYKVNG
jgi:hypothetical protein